MLRVALIQVELIERWSLLTGGANIPVELMTGGANIPVELMTGGANIPVMPVELMTGGANIPVMPVELIDRLGIITTKPSLHGHPLSQKLSGDETVLTGLLVAGNHKINPGHS